MKVRIPNAAEWMLGASLIGMAVIAGFLVVRAFEPNPVTFDSLDTVNSPKPGELLFIEATVSRVEKDSCTNGVQIDSRDANGVESRLPVPTRQVSGPFTRYAIVIPDVTQPGPYDVRVRETVYCGNGPRISETPWMAFEVVR